MKLIPDIAGFLDSNKKRNADPKSSINALELVITMIIFIVIGRFLDSNFDTAPVWTLVFAAIGIFGSFASAYYRYKATSEMLEKDKVWAEKKNRVSAPVETEESDELIIPKGYGKDD